MEKISSLSGMRVSYKRRDGNTTRCIDNAIQILFSGNICIVEDHWEFGKHRRANENLMGRILKRLSQEHHISNAIVDNSELTIKLSDNND